MAGGQPLRLGPFTGGLNTASDPTAIADAELVDLTNFELDIDGSLISRTPIQELQGHVGWTERILIIGEGIFGSDYYVIGSNSGGVYHFLNNTWTLITSTFQASVAIQYADKVYLVPKPGSGNGGKWDPVGGFVAVAAIPKGQAAVIHKERLFVCPGIDSSTNSSRLKFSDAGNFDVWDAANFIDVSQGDGSKLVDVTVFQDNLLLFKEHSTYVLSYDVRPADAVVREISSTIGVPKQFCVANYENQVYVIDHTGWVYEIINYDFSRLNTKVPFVRDETAPSPIAPENIFLSILEDRLICRFYRKVYVYGLRTRTWSEWESVSNSLQFFGPVKTIRPTTGNLYYAGSALTSNRGVYKFLDKYNSTDKEKYFGDSIVASDDFSDTATDSWANADTGQTWANAGGAAADYDKVGGEGTHSHTSVSVFRTSTLPLALIDTQQTIFVKTSALFTGAEAVTEVTARDDLANTLYIARLSFAINQTMTISLRKRIVNVETTLATQVTGLTHVANTKYGITLRVHGSQLQARAWLASSSEPITWQVTATDTSITAAGSCGVRDTLASGNTNTLPIVFSYDDYSVINLAVVNPYISCSVMTKNFDMAISHQFKRLWWWGVDISTPNDIIGTATPVIVSFSVKWRALESRTWRSLENNKWGQILTDPSSITTTIIGSGGLSRRFAKFDKSLRYRQINFQVQLKTQGSISDGPARLFTMTIVTESKQVVAKKVN